MARALLAQLPSIAPGKKVFSTDGAYAKPSVEYHGQLLNFSGVDAQGSPVAMGYALVPQEDADEFNGFSN